MITLEQLLRSREDRVSHQADLLGAYPGKSLLCLTVQLPGPEKRSPDSLAIGKAGVEAISKAFACGKPEIRDLETGFEAYLPVDFPPLEAKRIACHIEDTHPLGRLMDIDVITTTEDGLPRPVSRSEIGLEPRKCLLCSNQARYCMRARTHTAAQLLERISLMVKDYSQ